MVPAGDADADGEPDAGAVADGEVVAVPDTEGEPLDDGEDGEPLHAVSASAADVTATNRRRSMAGSSIGRARAARRLPTATDARGGGEVAARRGTMRRNATRGRCAVGYPRRLLNPDEDIVFDLHPHWKGLIGPTVLAPLIVFVATFGAGKIPEGSNQAKLRLLVAVLALAVLVWRCLVPYVKWYTTHYVVTTRRVLVRHGLVAREGRDIPIFRINDVTFKHTVVERFFGAGTLLVESAGESGQVVLGDIPHVEDVQRQIYTLMDADDARRRGGGRDPDPEG
jgi:membrane protein YdbS with pleckstrin-like domain